MTERQSPVCADGALTVLVWTTVAATIGWVRADPDLWGHVRFGLDLLRDRTLPVSDPYSFTSDLPWINHEWLSELQMAIAYRAAGALGLFALKIVLSTVAFAAVAWHTRRLPILLRGAMALVLMWASVPIVTTLRPQLWSFALAALLAILLVAERPSRRLWWIPAIFALWVNVHGGWVVGAGLVGVWAVSRAADSAWRPWVSAIALVAVFATLVNPYGVGLWVFLLKTVRLQRDIREWRSIATAPLVDWWPWLLTIGTGAGLVAARYRLGLQRIVTLLALAYASFRVVRLVPFFVLVSVIYLTRPLAELAARHTALRWRLLAPSRPAALLALVPSLVVAGITMPRALAAPAACVPIVGDWVPDPTTAMALQMARPTGRIVTYFGWGEYAIWHFGPALRVSIDGRRETVYSEKVLELLSGLESGDSASLAFLARERPDYVWMQASASERLRPWLTQHGYRLDLETSGAWLAVRGDRDVIGRPTVAAPGCFPG